MPTNTPTCKPASRLRSPDFSPGSTDACRPHSSAARCRTHPEAPFAPRARKAVVPIGDRVLRQNVFDRARVGFRVARPSRRVAFQSSQNVLRQLLAIPRDCKRRKVGFDARVADVDRLQNLEHVPHRANLAGVDRLRGLVICRLEARAVQSADDGVSKRHRCDQLQQAHEVVAQRHPCRKQQRHHLARAEERKLVDVLLGIWHFSPVLMAGIEKRGKDLRPRFDGVHQLEDVQWRRNFVSHQLEHYAATHSRTTAKQMISKRISARARPSLAASSGKSSRRSRKYLAVGLGLVPFVRQLVELRDDRQGKQAERSQALLTVDHEELPVALRLDGPTPRGGAGRRPFHAVDRCRSRGPPTARESRNSCAGTAARDKLCRSRSAPNS